MRQDDNINMFLSCDERITSMGSPTSRDEENGNGTRTTSICSVVLLDLKSTQDDNTNIFYYLT